MTDTSFLKKRPTVGSLAHSFIRRATRATRQEFFWTWTWTRTWTVQTDGTDG